jgi:hypothetical protein
MKPGLVKEKVWSIRSPFYSGCRTIWRAISNSSTTMPILPDELDSKASATGRHSELSSISESPHFHLTPTRMVDDITQLANRNPLGPHFRDYFSFSLQNEFNPRCIRAVRYCALISFGTFFQVIATGHVTLPKSIVGQINTQNFLFGRPRC